MINTWVWIPEECVVAEEFWCVGPHPGFALISATFGADMVEFYGKDEQKTKYLIPITEGELILDSAIIEPDAGSDVEAIITEAGKDGSDYIINGTKTFITNGTVARPFNVICLTNPENPSRHRRHCVIFIENAREGFEATKLTLS